MSKEANPFQIVENEFVNPGADREWELGIVLSVDQGDGYVWVARIGKDKDGYFLTNQLEYVNKDRLKDTHKIMNEIAIKLLDLNPATKQGADNERS